MRHRVIQRGAADYVRERLRRRLFPPLVARVPELRETFLWRRWFLTRRSAAFDLAAAGALAAAARRRPGPLALALPYAAIARAESAPWGGRRAWKVAAADLAADAAGAAALIAGSLRARRIVL